MNNSASTLDTALENLADITLGPSPSIWPLAWGWWVVIIISLLIAVGISWFLIQRMRKLRMKRRALKAISTIDINDAQALRKLHTVLRNAVKFYYPSANVNGLQGAAWQGFLASQADSHKQVNDEIKANLVKLEASLYTKEPAISIDEAQIAVGEWIKYCLPPSKNNREATLDNSKGAQHV